METIYYLSTLIIICLELSWIINPIKKVNDSKRFLELSKIYKEKQWSEYPEEYKSQIKSKFWLLYVIIWLFVGLFTFQWAGFLAIFIFNLLIISPLSKFTRYSELYTIIHWINSLIGFSFAIFVIINHYHLRIDLTKLFLNIL